MNYIDTTDTLRKAAALIDLKQAAQAVLDIERPGEKVQEILINSDSAKSLKELLNPPAPPLTKTVYTVMFGYLSDSGAVKTWPTLDLGVNKTELLAEAIEGLLDVQKNFVDQDPAKYFYFIEKSTVEA